MAGSIEILSPGYGATKSGDYWTKHENKKEDPFQMPNVIPCSKATIKQAKAELATLNQMIQQAHNPTPLATPASVHSPDNIALLQHLADLHTSGILTDQEYDAKKAEILRRI